MKKTATLFLLAIVLATTAFAQNDPLSVRKLREGTDTVTTLITQWRAAETYVPFEITSGYVQTISALYDTVTGSDYLIKVTAARMDTIKLKTSYYLPGQTFRFKCTNSANDSTRFVTSSGNIEGASTMWWTGTYKFLTLWFDGTNYWKL
jgi:hypothetical protein